VEISVEKIQKYYPQISRINADFKNRRKDREILPRSTEGHEEKKEEIIRYRLTQLRY